VSARPLALFRDKAHDFLQRMDEPHIQHLVSFIEDAQSARRHKRKRQRDAEHDGHSRARSRRFGWPALAWAQGLKRAHRVWVDLSHR